jgi:RHS repeat-associated protein
MGALRSVSDLDECISNRRSRLTWNRTKYTYDPVTHDLLSQTDSATGITTSQTYDKFGNLITQTNGRGYTSTSNYDPVTGLLMATADPLGHGVSYSYNNLGLQIAAQNSVGLGVSNITYDSFGNPSSVTDTANHPATYTRDSAGNVLTVTDAKGQVTQYTYDSFNHLLSVTTPKNEKTFYAYTPTGHVHQITDPFGNVTTFQYNALGQLVQTTDPLGMVSKRAYDANGNLAQETDPNGNVKTYSYDAANRLIKKTLPDDVISLSYDTRNSITQAANSVSAITFNYDDDERLTSVQSQGLGALINNPSASLSFNYDQDNDLVQLTDPVGASCYSYDAADRLNSLRNPKGEIYSFGLDAGNRLTSISRPGSQTSISYDTSGFMSSLVHLSGGTSIDSFTYQRDAMGNVNQITTPVATRTLAYDPDSQLTLATNPETTVPSMQGETFSYDQISNRTQDQSGSYNYDQHKQRLVQDYRYNYFYDNNGNLNSKQEIGTGFGTDGIAGEVTNYFYSSQNQLTGYKVYPTGATTGSPSKEVSYSYDALGRRIQKQVTDYTAESDPTKTFTRRYVYDGQQILLEYDGNNDLLARYTYSNLNADDVLAVDVSSSGVNAKLAQNSGTYLYLKDQLGSVVDIADTNGNKIQHYIYSAFGQLLGIQNAAASDVTSNPPLSTSFTFTGREHDSESGFYFYRARYYDPNTGRFLQKDPSPGKLSNASSVVNSYIYALNNPGNRVDPTGKFSFVEDVIIAVVAVSVAVAAVALAPFTLGGSAVLGGIVEGALVGALAGGATGAEINLKDGRNWSDNIGQALAIGAVAGGAAGGITGALSESSMISVQSVTNLSDLEDGVTSDYGTQTVGVTTDPNVAPFGETQSQQLDELAQNMHVIEITIEDSGSMAPIVNPLCIGATLPMMIVGWITGGPVGGVGSAEVAGVICQTVP